MNCRGFIRRSMAGHQVCTVDFYLRTYGTQFRSRANIFLPSKASEIRTCDNEENGREKERDMLRVIGDTDKTRVFVFVSN